MMKRFSCPQITFMLLFSLLTACGPTASLSYEPVLIPIAISVNTQGQISLSTTSAKISTPIGVFSLSGGINVGNIFVKYNNVRKLMVQVDDQITVYPLEEGKKFKIIFDEEGVLYTKVKLEYEINGDIFLELKSVHPIAKSAFYNGVWSGTYYCDVKPNGFLMELKIDEKSDISGSFHIYYPVNGKEIAAFAISGVYDPGNDHFDIKAGNWLYGPLAGWASKTQKFDFGGIFIPNGKFYGSIESNGCVNISGDKTNIPLNNASSRIQGKWTGIYYCGEKASQVDLNIKSDEQNHLTAIFTFSAPDGNDKYVSGSFVMTGQYDPSTQNITLKGTSWITQPPGWRFIDFEGKVYFNEGEGGVLNVEITTDGCSRIITKKID